MRLAVLLFALALTLFAQVNTSSVSGTVLDQSQAAVAGATVILINEDTGVRLTTKATEAGNFLFTPLQRCNYRLQVEAAGFKKTERGGLELQMGEKLGVNITLELGSVNETVEVKAESPLMTTTNASMGQVIDNQKILELPLPGRDPARLYNLSPAVGGVAGGMGDLRLGGGRTRLVEFYVDGSPVSAVSDAAVTALPSIDAIQELLLAEGHLTRRLFGAMVRRIEALPVPAG